MAHSNHTKTPQEDKISKSAALAVLESTLEFLGDATCALSVLRDGLEVIRQKAEEKNDYELEGEIDIFAIALKFFYNNFSHPYEDLAKQIKKIKEGELA